MLRLFQRRRHDSDRAAKAPKLTEAIPSAARAKIGHALSDYAYEGAGSALGPSLYNTTDWMILNERLKAILLRHWGVPGFREDDARALLARVTDVEVLDIVEAWFPAMRQVAKEMQSNSRVYDPGGFGAMLDRMGAGYRERINDAFDADDVAWQLMEERIVPRASMAMHATVVEPIFGLTHGDARLAAVESAYLDALRELKPGGNPSDAITDAGTALQAMLVAAGARGNALGPLLADARKRKILAPYDSKLAEAIEAVGEWVSADRSQRGDAHLVHDTSRDDAWLAVRVAGALILRLAAGHKR